VGGGGPYSDIAKIKPLNPGDYNLSLTITQDVPEYTGFITKVNMKHSRSFGETYGWFRGVILGGYFVVIALFLCFILLIITPRYPYNK
jgi:hypothetical protein